MYCCKLTFYYFNLLTYMDWIIERKNLVNEFEFSNYTEAIKFVNKILPLAEEYNHHPDILIHSYKKVKIMMHTHRK